MASVAIDLGATSGRVVLGKYTEDGIQMSEIHRFQNNIIKVNGRSYWDLLGLWHEILTGLRKASASGEKIESVGPEIGEAFDQGGRAQQGGTHLRGVAQYGIRSGGYVR